MSKHGMAITAKEKEMVLELIRSRPGMNASVLCKHSDMNYKRLLQYIRLLNDEGLIIKEGNTSSSRYYDREYVSSESNNNDVAAIETIPITESFEKNDDKVNIDRILDSIDLLRTVHITNTGADVFVSNAIEELERKVSDSILPCPFCGSLPTIVKGSGQYHIECSCGCLFAYSKSTRSAEDTIDAYNRRVQT